MNNKANPDSVFSLAGAMCTRMNKLGLSQEIVDKIKRGAYPSFWKNFDSLLLNTEGSEVSIDDDTNRQVNFWKAFYKTHFGIDLDMSEVKIPARQGGFGWLVVVAQGISLNQVWEICRKQFDCWKYTDSDLESIMQESECGPAQTTTARWFRDRIEADEEMKNLSAQQLSEQNIAGITLMERLLLELKVFSETGKHLDHRNWTLCSGSRYSGGCVPGVRWNDDWLGVSWRGVGFALSDLRSRVAVG